MSAPEKGTLGLPPGYESVQAAAGRFGFNPEVLKRKCRAKEVAGAYKVPWRGGGLWVVPKKTRKPSDRRRALNEKDAREIARRAHAGANKASLAREYGINRSTVYDLMERYPKS